MELMSNEGKIVFLLMFLSSVKLYDSMGAVMFLLAVMSVRNTGLIPAVSVV